MKTFNPQALLRPNLTGLKSYSSAREEYAMETGMSFLDANENPFDSGLNRYPDPQQQALKNKLAELKQVAASKIILGNGSDELLDLLIRCFCQPGVDTVISLPPTYGMYGILSRINGVQVVEVPLTKDFQPDLDAISQAVQATTKILFLCSPNNPSGNSFEPRYITNILESFPGIVVLDEAYADFADKSWLDSLDKYPNLVILQTFSKAYGLAGVRLGAGYASEEIIRLLNKIKLPYNVNLLTQQVALERLEDSAGIDQEIQNILDQRAYLHNRLESMPFVRKIYPSDANFLLVKVDDALLRYKQFLEAGIVVRNRSGELNCEQTLRITVGTPQENDRLLKVAENFKQI